MTIDDIDLVEINEAFAAQVIPSASTSASRSTSSTPWGAIALGHPFGMTGARIMTTLLIRWKTPEHGSPGVDVRRRRSGNGHDRRAAGLRTDLCGRRHRDDFSLHRPWRCRVRGRREDRHAIKRSHYKRWGQASGGDRRLVSRCPSSSIPSRIHAMWMTALNSVTRSSTDVRVVPDTRSGRTTTIIHYFRRPID